ncbi:DUF814 domain-containing protein [candidate division GN15 bacterium]|nr:DUF814 domain-containing protein [candidate division GN15 bacterium]
MQTALHIQVLVAELNGEITGARLTATEFYRKERAAFFHFKRDKKRLALSFVFHPAGSGTFLAPSSKVTPDTREKPWPIFGLQDAEVISIQQRGLDRIFDVALCTPDGDRTLVFEAIGPNGNVWLLDDSQGRLAVLRRREFTAGEPYQIDQPLDRHHPFRLTSGALKDLLNEYSHSSLINMVERSVLGFNRTLARESIHRAGLDDIGPSAITDSELETLTAAITGLAERFSTYDTGYLYQIRHAFEAYPFKLSFIDEQPEKFKTLSLAVMEFTRRRQTAVEEEDEQKKVMSAVTRAIKRLKKRFTKIESDVDKAADFEKYKRLAELLQINRDHMKKGMSEITVDDILSNSGSITIPLDSALSATENIEHYFRKHRKGREGLETLQRRLAITRDELSSLEQIRDDLETNFDQARERYAPEIASLLPREATKRETAPRLPYREHTLSTGLTIFIGRDGSDNDRTTFEFARPYEFWFHTQQCPGSHVVMKFPNKSFVPSRVEIEETAAIAAWHSKARNDSLVPVVYTERKYVRKPRKAKPGLVTVEREKSVMVEPKKPE